MRKSRLIYLAIIFVWVILGAGFYNIEYGIGKYETEIEQSDESINLLSNTVSITTYVWVRKNRFHVGGIHYSSYKFKIPYNKIDSVKKAELKLAKLASDTILLNLTKLR